MILIFEKKCLECSFVYLFFLFIMSFLSIGPPCCTAAQQDECLAMNHSIILTLKKEGWILERGNEYCMCHSIIKCGSSKSLEAVRQQVPSVLFSVIRGSVWDKSPSNSKCGFPRGRDPPQSRTAVDRLHWTWPSSSAARRAQSLSQSELYGQDPTVIIKIKM